MRLPLPSFASAVALFATVVCVQAEDAKTYTIKLERPAKPGDKTRDILTVRYEKTDRATIGDKVLKDSKRTIKADVAGLRETLEVSPKGNTHKFKFTVEKFNFQVDSKTMEPIKPGTVITAAMGANGKGVFTSSEGDLPEIGRAALGVVFEFTPDDRTKQPEDVVYGTTEPRAVGSEWDFKMSDEAKSLPVASKVKFLSVKQHEGKEHCLIQATIISHSIGELRLPSGFKLTNSKATGGIERLVPVDPTALLPYSKLIRSTEATGTFQTPAGEATMEIADKKVTEVESRPAE